jgi:hypothetical protein
VRLTTLINLNLNSFVARQSARRSTFIKLNSKPIKLKFDRRTRWGCTRGNALGKPRGAVLPGARGRAPDRGRAGGRGRAQGRQGATPEGPGAGTGPRTVPGRQGRATPLREGLRRRARDARARGTGGVARRDARARGTGGSRAGTHARGGRAGSRAGEKKGARNEEERGGEGKREREGERGGELTSGSRSGDHRLQNLGHHGGEREVEERRLLRGKIK